MVKKGMSIEECVSEASRLISENGVCLLTFDAVDSRNSPDRAQLQLDLFELAEDLSKRFKDYMPENDLVVRLVVKKGFSSFLGDRAMAGINSAEVIPEIITYQKQHYSHILLHWEVVEDGYALIDRSMLRYKSNVT